MVPVSEIVRISRAGVLARWNFFQIFENCTEKRVSDVEVLFWFSSSCREEERFIIIEQESVNRAGKLHTKTGVQFSDKGIAVEHNSRWCAAASAIAHLRDKSSSPEEKTGGKEKRPKEINKQNGERPRAEQSS